MEGTVAGPTCPRCFARVGATTHCGGCALEFETVGQLLDTLGGRERERRAAAVERFYTRNPFPGYAPADDAGSRRRRPGAWRPPTATQDAKRIVL